MIEAVEREDTTPLCPCCSEPLHTVHYRRLSSTLGKRYVYFCAVCKKVLGISHRKGFWMG